MEKIRKIRCGIYSKMMSGTFKDEDLQSIEINQNDCVNAIQKLSESKTKRSDRVVVKVFRA